MDLYKRLSILAAGLGLFVFVGLLFQTDTTIKTKNMEITALQAQVAGLRQMISAGVVVPVFDGVTHKKPKAMMPKK